MNTLGYQIWAYFFAKSKELRTSYFVIDLGAIHKCQHFHEWQIIHFGGVGGCENQHFPCTLLTFWPDFYYFHGDFWHSKDFDVYSLFWRQKGYQKLYGLNTHENVDIYGWPLRIFKMLFGYFYYKFATMLYQDESY